MFGDVLLTFRECVMNEPLPAGEIQQAVLAFMRGRTDAAVFGAHAVNAYVDTTRNTEDVDIQSTRAVEFAEELRQHLNQQFGIAARVREVRGGIGYRIYQLRKEGDRHLVDIRPVPNLLPLRWVDDVPVIEPAEVVADKVTAWVARKGKPKAGTDWRDLAQLLLTFPYFKTYEGTIYDLLIERDADPAVFAAWQTIVDTPITAESDEDEFDY